jgi:hypothetical protein
MTKNTRRSLFLVVATVANMLLTIVLVVALVLLWSVIANKLGILANSMAIAVMVAFIAAVVISGFVYSKVLKAIQNRPDLMERYGLLKK